MIRFTSNAKSLDGHDLNNGSVYRVNGFDKKDNIILDNGWTVGKNFKHLKHGYVKTSVGAQGKTVDRVLIAMGSESKGAINAEQFLRLGIASTRIGESVLRHATGRVEASYPANR